ncbi:glycosyltransferase [Comamonas badia]|uniref:glycosyltransferase n=1 Tax=Comamonas badia TaxID=265291 RepID=UPI00046660CC|nr:glycosyltransferase [Comamonas badia]
MSHASACLIVSPIPVLRAGDQWRTLDLWARDVNAQCTQIPVTLVCPVAAQLSHHHAPLAPAIRVIAQDDRDALAHAIARARFVQIPGHTGWRNSALARQVLKLARSQGKPVFLGISSNRARTALLNSRQHGVARYALGLLRYADIRFTQRWLARRCTGVFVVGAGLTALVRGANANVHVGIASWVSAQDIQTERPPAPPTLRICMAGRLEPMKGFSVGLAALEALKARMAMDITLIGSGPEEAALKAAASQRGLHVRFLAPIAYPGPFFALLDQQDLVLLTNLNDEQPRLVFDALCRGALPVCPDAAAYAALGLDRLLLYRQGDAQALAQCVRGLEDPDVRGELRVLSAALLQRHTLDAMHSDRLAWMQTSAARIGSAPASP